MHQDWNAFVVGVCLFALVLLIMHWERRAEHRRWGNTKDYEDWRPERWLRNHQEPPE